MDVHVGTKDPDSSASSLSGGRSPSHKNRDWNAERRQGQALKFWKKPVIRQVKNSQSCFHPIFPPSDLNSTGIKVSFGDRPKSKR